jgi:hypothetical protein
MAMPFCPCIKFEIVEYSTGGYEAGELIMRFGLIGICVVAGLLGLQVPVSAMPSLVIPTLDPAEMPIVLAATANQKSAARAACRRQFGKRLTDVRFKGSNYFCVFRPSLKNLTRNASKTCAKRGQRLVKFTSIKYGKRVTNTRFLCR